MSEELAWAAGLFDGEGSVSVSGRRTAGRWATIDVALGMTDAESVVRFARIIGIGTVSPWRHFPSQAGRRPMRYWRATGSKGLAAMEMLKPWLSSVKLADYDYAKRMAPNAGTGMGTHMKTRKHAA